MQRVSFLIGILVAVALLQSCGVQYTCPAYQSYFDFEETDTETVSAEELDQKDQTMGEDSSAAFEAYNEDTTSNQEPEVQSWPRRDQYLRGVKLSKRKKWKTINTVPMKVDWPEDTSKGQQEEAPGDTTGANFDEDGDYGPGLLGGDDEDMEGGGSDSFTPGSGAEEPNDGQKPKQKKERPKKQKQETEKPGGKDEDMGTEGGF